MASGAERFEDLEPAHSRQHQVQKYQVGSPVSRCVEPGWPARYVDDPRWGPAMTRPVGLLDPDVLGSERWRTTPFPAVNLHASARGLATFYADLLGGEVERLLGPELHAEYVNMVRLHCDWDDQRIFARVTNLRRKGKLPRSRELARST